MEKLGILEFLGIFGDFGNIFGILSIKYADN